MPAIELERRERRAVAYDAELARRLWTYIRPHRALIWGSLALLFVTSACGLALPWLVKIAIDDYIVPAEGRGMGAGTSGFAWILLAFAAIALVEIAGKAWQTWTIDKAGQNSLLDLRMAVFAHLQRLRSSFYDKTPIGRLVGRVTTDVEALQEMFSSGVVTILGDLVFLVATIVILFAMHWQLAAVTMLVVPVLLALTMWIRVHVRHAYGEMVARRSQLNAFLHEHVAGMPIIQMFVREKRTRGEFADVNEGMCRWQIEAVRWESILSAGTELLGNLTLALILWYGGRALVALAGGDANALTDSGLTIGVLYAFIDYMGRFFGPLNELSLKYTVMQNAMTASDRIFSLLDKRELTAEPDEPVAAHEAHGSIVFDRVTFGYDPQEPVLRDVSFEVAPGERVAIVGATGSGKTTILKLLTRLYDVDAGTIELDGVDVRRYALRDLRRRVGIVPQDVFLFGGDVLSNIRLGHPEITESDARAAADRLHLDQVVARFPRRYREPVRERGANLSSGERQLVAFARVLAVAPPVLALDEATSNVDTNTEHLLQDAVHELMKGRTSLIIAHRLSTIRDVDRILVMHQGRIVEQGSHDELLARGGTYARLYRLQYSDQEEGAA